MGLQEMGVYRDLTGSSGDELLPLLGSETNEGQCDPDAVRALRPHVTVRVRGSLAMLAANIRSKSSRSLNTSSNTGLPNNQKAHDHAWSSG
jgi:hypothetical protein